MGAAVPKTQTVYSTTTGLPTDNQALNSSGSVTADINSTYDDFGQALSYTDAAGNPTAYAYDINGRPTSRNDGKGTQTLTYDKSFGSPTAITDSQAGSFSATYNADGKLLTEQYPGTVTGRYTYDATGTPVSLSYNGAAWTTPLSDTVVPNAAGDWASQAITDTGTATPLVSTQVYSYDNADRVTGAQGAENGQCTTRAYAYDADSNRTRLTTYAPSSDGTCQSSTAASTATTSYDSADRDTNAGYGYDTQGDITTTPSADAGGGGNLTAAYYANDMLASQAQGSQAISWTLDPNLGRYETRTQSSITYTNHYSDNGNNPTWTAGSNGTWTRNVTDFNGSLAAVVSASGVTLELPDLHGDVLAAATTSTTATGPASTYVYTEFGTPESGAPGTYGWLGADQVPGSALGGELLTGARAYNPNAGHFDQVDPLLAVTHQAYTYAGGNPVNETDPLGLIKVRVGGGGYVAIGLSPVEQRAILQGLIAAALGAVGYLIGGIFGATFAAYLAGHIGTIVAHHYQPKETLWIAARVGWKHVWGPIYRPVVKRIGVSAGSSPPALPPA